MKVTLTIEHLDEREAKIVYDHLVKEWCEEDGAYEDDLTVTMEPDDA